MNSSARPCGFSEGQISVNGLDFAADLAGTLYSPDYGALLVADLHLEKGSSRARHGVHLPPYDTRATLSALKAVLLRYRPKRLIALGDSFHDRAGPDRLDAADLAAIRGLSEVVEVVWITGNHDPELPSLINGHVARELALGPVVLRHQPRAGAKGEIAGHLHPVAAVNRRGRRLRCKCFVGDGDRLIMPAFGAYTGGLSVHAAPFEALFPMGRFQVWMIGRRAIHAFPAERVS